MVTKGLYLSAGPARFYLLFLLLPAICLFLPGWIQADETTPVFLDFIYVNANTGEAAGGHVAVRMESTIFHYQFFPQGRFLLVRDSWSHFRYVYNELNNRSIFIARLPLTSRVYRRVRNHFTGLLIEQQQNLDRLRNGREQLYLIEQLVDGSDQVELPVIGLFDKNRVGNPTMGSLQQMVLQQLGPAGYAAKFKRIGQSLTSCLTEPGVIRWSSRAAEIERLLLEREFFQLVQEGASLSRDSVVGLAADPDLSPDEKIILTQYRKKLAESVADLLQAIHPGQTEALLLQTARYLVVSRSLATGRLLTLDPFSSAAVTVFPKPGDNLQPLADRLLQDAVRARINFFQESEHPDIAYALLETAMGRLDEVEGAILFGRPVRVEPGILLPDRRGRVSVQGIPKNLSLLSRTMASIKTSQHRLQLLVGRQYEYNLIRHNCATELIQAVNTAFPDPETGRRELGGWLEPGNDLNFIPHRLFSRVNSHFPVMETVRLPSRRLRNLAALYPNEKDLTVRLRESNTLSSTLYTPRIQDTPFLFFTDDSLVLRPVYGLANLCWAALHGATGIISLPVDGGERLHQGIRGMFYSLPELVFNNIRKGTYGVADIVPSGP